MKMKTKKIVALSASLILIALFVATSNVSAEVNILSVDYPESVIIGETISVIVYFEYTDTNTHFFVGPHVELFYSINSLSVLDAFIVTAPVATGSRPASVSFTIITYDFQDGDILRFDIRYAILENNVGIDALVSGMFRIDIIDQTVDETGLSIIGLTLALITVAAIVTRKKKTS